jgi:membrane-associated phospholipid phosphatase
MDDERFFHRARNAAWVGVGLLALFALVGLLVPAEPLAVERRWLEWMQDVRTPVLDHVALVFNYLGRGLGRAFVLIGIGLVLAAVRRWEALVAFAVTEALTPALNSVAKALVERPRPPDGLVHPGGSSFPSGHTAFAAATLVALVLLFTAPGPRRRRWWSLAAAGTAGMAWSRTYLQVHWLLDVLAAAILGAGIALLVFAAVDVLRRRRPAMRG